MFCSFEKIKLRLEPTLKKDNNNFNNSSEKYMKFYIAGTMSQAGIDPLAQSHTFYEVSSLPTSHHGWISLYFNYYTKYTGLFI